MTTRIVTDINGRKHITNEPLLRLSHRETVSNQPEALRLADALDPLIRNRLDNLTCATAAAELRRLHAENERLHQINQAHEMKLSVRGYEIQIEDLKAAYKELLAAQQRTLTDEMIADLWHANGGFHHHFARAVERWLKGKDHA